MHRPWYIVAPFALFTAALGVFLAIPMKRQMVNQEQLKFPSGIAAAETLRSLYSKGAEAMKKAYALAHCAGGGRACGAAAQLTARWPNSSGTAAGPRCGWRSCRACCSSRRRSTSRNGSTPFRAAK